MHKVYNILISFYFRSKTLIKDSVKKLNIKIVPNILQVQIYKSLNIIDCLSNTYIIYNCYYLLL